MKTEWVMGKTEWVLLFALSIIWGGSFFFAKIALAEIPPLYLVFFRVALAAMALFILLKAMDKHIPTSAFAWKAFLGMGVLNNLIPFSLLFWSQTHISSGLASIFNASVPVFTVIIAHFSTSDERLSRNKIIGVLLGLLGVGIMIGADLSSDINGWAVIAMLACVGAALSYGFASVYGRRFQQMKMEPLVVAFGQVTASAVIMAFFLLFFAGPLFLSTLSAPTILSTMALALISTALAYVIFFRVLAKGGATNISLVTLLIPVSAIMLGVVFLDEQVKLSHIIGMLTIFAGLLAIDGRVFAYLSKKVKKTKQIKSICIECKKQDWGTQCKL